MSVTTPDRQDERAKSEDPTPILCAACEARITLERERIAISGHHVHRFLNPGGFVFDIGCFREAPGCGCSGEPSTEFTWFPPLAWRVAHCATCFEHLGWAFENPSQVMFYGLILNRLKERGAPST